MTVCRPRYSEDIVPFTEYRNNLTRYFIKTRETHRPILVTQNGRATTVVMNVEDFEQTWDMWEDLHERQELSKAVAISRQQFAEGKFIAHEELMDMLEQKLAAGVTP